MVLQRNKHRVHPIGIDLGTTYSCVSQLTSSGQPVAVPNTEGELSTPSIVLFDGDQAVVGTEALRNSVTMPERVVKNAKRFMGDPNKSWVIDRKVYRPKDISALILRKLLDGAEERLGPISHAVITVPAQFSDVQRQLTVEAGIDAGLEKVDIINEPVATAMCHVLSEGMWFAELANEQTVLVFDLGGGTFDLSLVRYNKDEVKVIASGGDLRLGGLDWNQVLEEFACDRYVADSISDPRLDRESMQALAIEVEQVKRSLSVRPRASIVVQHDGRRKTFAIERDQFEGMTSELVKRTENITRGMLKAHGLGWAHVDSVLVTGGASRMPMIRSMLKRISGTTLNTTLSPDQSIAHGAAYYAGMLLSGEKLEQSSLDRTASARLQNFHQQSVTGRDLGILVRDPEEGHLRPHYLIPANTPLPCAYQQRFGTVVENQKRVHLHIVESGATLGEEYVELGDCLIDELPPDLPKGSPIEVTIRYNDQGRVKVTAVESTSGLKARATIVRSHESKTRSKESAAGDNEDIDFLSDSEFEIEVLSASAQKAEDAQQKSTQQQKDVGKESEQPVPKKNQVQRPLKSPSKAKAPAKDQRKKQTKTRRIVAPKTKRKSASLETAERPIPLCNTCGHPLEKQGRCLNCDATGKRTKRSRRSKS